MYIKGYFFATKTLANAKVKVINEGEGIPVTPEATTTTYTTIEKHPTDGYWYIRSDDITEKYLGKGEEIELPDPDPFHLT